MPWITIGTPPFDSIEKMDEVFAQVGALPDGSQARYAGKAEDGTLRIVTIWETRAHADRFFTETLGPTLAKLMGPEPVGTPDVLGIDVQRSHARQPVA